MSKHIRISKGLDINLVGEAKKEISTATKSNTYAINPSDFHGIVPRLISKEGAEVKAGSPVFCSKSNPEMLFPAPVSGEVVEVVRGAKRKIESIRILADKEQRFEDFGILDVEAVQTDAIKAYFLQSGCWPFIKQRPYDVIANPSQTPKSIFVSGYATAPLAADCDFFLQGKETQLQLAITALSKLTTGSVHVSVSKTAKSPLSALHNCVLHTVAGPHPVGNVGTQIAHIDPLNKGEVVWVISPQDLLIVGELLSTGRFNPDRIVALAGASVKEPKYYTTKIGAEIATLVYDSGIHNGEKTRIISGDVLTGRQIAHDGHLGYYHNTVTVIEEGDDYEFFGWNKPVFNKISPSRAFTFSWLFPNKKYNLNTNTNGEHRAFVVTGSYENVFPMDIYPLQLLKACMVRDLDAMEQLGMYEVAPEDFALTEFICVSKQPHQQIIREALDFMLKEIG